MLCLNVDVCLIFFRIPGDLSARAGSVNQAALFRGGVGSIHAAVLKRRHVCTEYGSESAKVGTVYSDISFLVN